MRGSESGRCVRACVHCSEVDGPIQQPQGQFGAHHAFGQRERVEEEGERLGESDCPLDTICRSSHQKNLKRSLPLSHSLSSLALFLQAVSGFLAFLKLLASKPLSPLSFFSSVSLCLQKGGIFISCHRAQKNVRIKTGITKAGASPH